MPPSWAKSPPSLSRLVLLASPWFLHSRIPCGCPIGPLGIKKLGGEPLFREPIYKPTNGSLDIYEVFPGDLDLWIAITHKGHQNALLSGSGIAWLPSLLEPLHLPTLRCVPGGLLVLIWALCGPLFVKIQAQVYWVHVSSIFPLFSSGFQTFQALAESMTGYFEMAELSCYQTPQ